MVVETVLALATITMMWISAKARNIHQRDKKLLTDNTIMAEHVLETSYPQEEDAHSYRHTWSEPSQDTLYTSKVPWSYDQVILNVSICIKCQVVHRYIVSGMELARKKGLCSEEGLFYSGSKIMTPGCLFPDEHHNKKEWQEIAVLDEESSCVEPHPVVQS